MRVHKPPWYTELGSSLEVHVITYCNPPPDCDIFLLENQRVGEKKIAWKGVRTTPDELSLCKTGLSQISFTKMHIASCSAAASKAIDLSIKVGVQKLSKKVNSKSLWISEFAWSRESTVEKRGKASGDDNDLLKWFFNFRVLLSISEMSILSVFTAAALRRWACTQLRVNDFPSFSFFKKFLCVFILFYIFMTAMILPDFPLSWVRKAILM